MRWAGAIVRGVDREQLLRERRGCALFVAVLLLGGLALAAWGCFPSAEESDREWCESRGGFAASREYGAARGWVEWRESAERGDVRWCVIMHDSGKVEACDMASRECLPRYRGP